MRPMLNTMALTPSALVTSARSSTMTRMSVWRRSEEHTSELQSHSDLVCRLLLEKKKHKHSRLNKKQKKISPKMIIEHERKYVTKSTYKQKTIERQIIPSTYRYHEHALT